ncbi:sigma factor [Dyella terrae]|uniref:sigma factor n=1 Tax=Dyella terrae TaxID=522259 RepID=UPI0025789F5F|nr:sigma factor [Dyella terrae]ULU26068.1 sigma-70 family RNA polymerase sigma factor [Dyella terrae]
MSISSTPASRAVEALYADHHGWLRGWLRHRLGNESDAADLAQDTFVRVIRSRQAPEIRQPRDFLATVARGAGCRLFPQAHL